MAIDTTGPYLSDSFAISLCIVFWVKTENDIKLHCNYIKYININNMFKYVNYK